MKLPYPQAYLPALLFALLTQSGPAESPRSPPDEEQQAGQSRALLRPQGPLHRITLC
ncbi:hypothetical protein PtA15_2A209 [Puccinia triticina]|uniref:Uncharacterized protein n=1 Tax=Puccinia triticina TaxID=208348 RepID=A0ABY7CCM4_9BASI|nr:uncharacterized protein PtA15_2A209 [Puccinia triticina]WAQ81896.1 hypothetical protein PtA15_2A209 [Puccinia triticina]